MKKTLITLLGMMTLICSCVPTTNPNIIVFPKIDRHPDSFQFDRGILSELPIYKPGGSDFERLQIPDLRGYDLSDLDLRSHADYLMYSLFDDQTKWPDKSKMPATFDINKIINYGKNPGLGVQELHALGYTGKNVGIAIIDSKLFVDHQEYKDQLRLYEEMDDIVGGRSEIHGSAVASIAVGKTVGVAPDADLYYIATHDGMGDDCSYLAKAINRIREINGQLPENRKIRVISISDGWDSKVNGYDQLMEAVNQATAENIFVISSSLDLYTPYLFNGLGRYPLDDPDNSIVYLPGFFTAKYFYTHDLLNNRLLVPMDSRTLATPAGIDQYAFYPQGGWSWAIPYIAGVYALAVQADPKITPDKFWKIAMETGSYNTLVPNGKSYRLGPIINPAAIIETVQKQNN
jgi:hypothetical protein